MILPIILDLTCFDFLIYLPCSTQNVVFKLETGSVEQILVLITEVEFL